MEMKEISIDWSRGLVPCIIQDDTCKTVLMLGYMSEEAFEKTVDEKQVTFFSRSKNRLWTKGETSGNFLQVKEILQDCDQDALLIRVIPNGPVCHTGKTSCFEESKGEWSLATLEEIIQNRKQEPTDGSYTSKLFSKGINKIAQKVGEEAVELVIEAKDNNEKAFLNEAADLLYHYLVLLAAKDKNFKDVEKVLRERHHAIIL